MLKYYCNSAECAGYAKDYSLNACATGVPVAVAIHTFKWMETFDMDKSAYIIHGKVFALVSCCETILSMGLIN